MYSEKLRIKWTVTRIFKAQQKSLSWAKLALLFLSVAQTSSGCIKATVPKKYFISKSGHNGYMDFCNKRDIQKLSKNFLENIFFCLLRLFL